MSSKPVIRHARREDVAACARIEALCFPAAEAASPEKIDKRQRLYPEGFLVAELDGELVGLINSGATSETDLTKEELKDMVGHDPEGENLVVFSVAVEPSHQRRGISAKLLEAFAENGRALGKKAVLLLCKENLVSYYERFGYVDMGESSSTHGGERWHEMRLDLTPRANP